MMDDSRASLAWKSGALVAFVIGCALVFGFLLSGTGSKLPLTGDDYRASFVTEDVLNLVPAGEVRLAGVDVGQVEEVENLSDGGARVEFSLDSEAAPLHEGVEVRVGERSLVGEGYVKVTAGDGAELDSGTQLPPSAVQPSVQLHDVLRSLDSETRESLGGLFRTLGEATDGSHGDVAKMLEGMGDLGREGHTAIDAIAAQSEDLTALTRETSAVLEALNTGEGQIQTLVESADRLTSATSGHSEQLEQTMRRLPGVLERTQVASTELADLSGALVPVAADLRSAAPDVNTALKQLPETTEDLRGLLPSLDSTLVDAPATLERLPRFNQDLRSMVPQLETMLSHVNPMLDYIEPYGHELAAFFTNFSGILAHTDEEGINYLKIQPFAGHAQAPVGSPFTLPDPLSDHTPYPAPGTLEEPGTGQGFEKVRSQSDEE
ncbi:phospholipid/cholesterol/gamma-HCH transport system substrate-binding protein [Haloechinothrix alba]|uniref:Phospholipid/cholesterol/gamma-HCH transport system substrate-binding protein n=1 Tax=Haloechinothrix alba TaxID=664784 RepID=A0A238XQV6_9PSEU|nr:MlaD family protein [Haloechinothrix alba]SNR60359.1 phospholipid/cholesterol/gamma-HCH transport system substrate-binding protein [Haloechinothrix alba]